jgi:casein kinase 1
MKPENMCIGGSKHQNLLYLIDFGLSKRYIAPQTCQHNEEKKSRGVVGTIKFLSQYA